MSQSTLEPLPIPRTDTSDLERQATVVKHGVQDLGRMAGRHARHRLVELQDRGREIGREVVERRPLTSLVAAAGVGALAAGLLLLVRRS